MANYIRVPFTGAEKESLRAALDRQRTVVLWKIEDLDDEQLRRPMTPSGTTLLGLVKHLAAVEFGWFCETFGRPVELLPSIDYDADEESDMHATPDETTEQIVAFYRRAWTAANEALDEIDLETVGQSWDGNPVSMRWVALHMLEEDARHAGHMDILRELIDGRTGDHDRSATTAG
jgi:uncharacterized damage-inducible protein DinB